jgi:hypothetical protein
VASNFGKTCTEKKKGLEKLRNRTLRAKVFTATSIYLQKDKKQPGISTLFLLRREEIIMM